MKRMSVLLGLCLAIVAGEALAVGSLADVSIYDRASGRVLPVYHADGRWYLAGRTGNEYEIRIRNNTAGDLLAVVSVDGVNVVSGETASTSQGGYVVAGWQALSIQGWRKSLDRVAAFYFTDHSDAYATRTGRPDEVGVIGVAVFKRKIEPPVELEQPPARRDLPYDETPPRQERYDGSPRSQAPEPSSNASGGAGDAADRASKSESPPSSTASEAARAMEKRIGTGHGRAQTSHVRYVSFERESDTPNEVIGLNYDTRANLVARGIIRTEPWDPNPFPARFVPDPPRRW
jgi:hypothetical protein